MAVLALLLLLAATAAGKLIVARLFFFFSFFFFTLSRSDNQQVDHAYIFTRVLLNYRTSLTLPQHTGCKGSLFVSLPADSQYVCYRSTSCGDGAPRPVFALGETVEDCCGQPNVRSARRREIGASDNCSSCGECVVCLLWTEFFVSVQH